MDAFLPLAEVDDATWERVFAVNVTAVMRLTGAVLPIMLAAGGWQDRQCRCGSSLARVEDSHQAGRMS
jgi:NAD(P)-dependent dehydrogenase (short-subunit alcohol dehydrogenase family)